MRTESFLAAAHRNRYNEVPGGGDWHPTCSEYPIARTPRISSINWPRVLAYVFVPFILWMLLIAFGGAAFQWGFHHVR